MIFTEVNINIKSGVNLTYEEPEVCPICKHAIKPETISRHYYVTPSKVSRLAVTFVCPHCLSSFLSAFLCFPDPSGWQKCVQEYTAPIHHEDQVFDKEIELLSPRFVRIYNQASAADESSLDELAGIGYRKALEFLVKDYCIAKNPDDSDKIKSMPLSNCIQTYISSPAIKTLSTKASWIGNDETHYVRRLEDRDVEDLKRFIRAVVHYIDMELIVEDAASIPHA